MLDGLREAKDYAMQDNILTIVSWGIFIVGLLALLLEGVWRRVTRVLTVMLPLSSLVV